LLAPFAKAVEPGHLVRVTKLPPKDSAGVDIGPATTVDAHVTGVRHQWGFTGWTVTLFLDASRAGRTFFKWGTSTWGGSDGWAF